MIDRLPIALSFVLAGAAWRFVDGLSYESSGVRTGVRNVVTIALCLAAAHAAGPGWWALWAGGWAATSIIAGKTDWHDPTWQAMRFGGMAAVAALPFGLTGLPYVGLCIVGGLAYPALARIDAHLPRVWLFDGFEAYARLALGGSVIGGLVLLYGA